MFYVIYKCQPFYQTCSSTYKMNRSRLYSQWLSAKNFAYGTASTFWGNFSILEAVSNTRRIFRCCGKVATAKSSNQVESWRYTEDVSCYLKKIPVNLPTMGYRTGIVLGRVLETASTSTLHKQGNGVKRVIRLL